MPKRILLAEESETIRKIAESLLRQNGFEVLSMTTGEKALEVLNFTSPDLILTATDMMYKGGTTFYDKLQSDAKTAKFPLLLLANEGESDLPLPPEAVIVKPFDPREFMEKINLFSGNTKPTAKNPLAASEVADEFLDAALGLDRIDVTDSEIMNQTVSGRIKKVDSVEKMIGYDHQQENTDITSDSRKVESLMIREDDTDMDNAHKKAEQNQKKYNETGSLEILDDQFGMEQPAHLTPQKNHSDHDYNWFLDELANENSPAKQKQKEQNVSDSQSLKFESTSSFVDPITPAISQKETRETSSVDKFIDEFKKEVEKFGSDEPESITLNEPKQQKLSESGSVLQWTDSIEKITPQQVELFKKEFVRELADKIAIKIVSKIDSDKLLQLLKQEIINKAKKL